VIKLANYTIFLLIQFIKLLKVVANKKPVASAHKSNFSPYFENANAEQERVMQYTPARHVRDPVRYINIFNIKPLNSCSTLSVKCVKAYAATS